MHNNVNVFAELKSGELRCWFFDTMSEAIRFVTFAWNLGLYREIEINGIDS